MAVIRIKDNVPQPYVSESRDFQLLTRVLDVSQNAVKFDIDSMVNILDTELISSNYLERLASKLGFFTSNIYDEKTLRKVLSAFPHIMRYKGSREGVERCVNTFLNIMGISESRIDIYNKDDTYRYMIRVGIGGNVVSNNTQYSVPDIQILKDVLKYVIPTGYVFEIYSYHDSGIESLNSEFDSSLYTLPAQDATEFAIVRSEPINIGEYSELKSDTYNTVQLGALYDTVDEKIEEGLYNV